MDDITANELRAMVAQARQAQYEAESRASNFQQQLSDVTIQLAQQAATAEKRITEMQEKYERAVKEIKEEMMKYTNLSQTGGTFTKPEKFHSERAKFRDWAFETKGYFCSVNHVVTEAFEWAEQQGKTSFTMEELGLTGLLWVPLSTQLYHNLTGLLKGESKNMLKNAKELNGLEVWRKITHFYDPELTTTRRKVTMANLLNPSSANWKSGSVW